MAKKVKSRKGIDKEIKRIENNIHKVLNDDSKLFAFIATFFSLAGFVIALLARRSDRYVMFYAKQSLLVFVVYLISSIAVSLPGFGWIIGPLIYIAAVLLWILSWFYAIGGEFREVPIVGKYVKYLRF